MVDRARIVAALECLYAHHDGDLNSWVRGVTAAAHRLLGEGGPVGAMLMDSETFHFLDVVGLTAETRAFMHQGIASTPDLITPERFATTFRGPSMVTLWSSLGLDVPELNEFHRQMGAKDLLGIAGEPEPGLAFVVFVAFPQKRAVGGAERGDLTRIALHLEASARARLRPESIIGTVTPSGHIELGEHVPSLRARDDVRQQIGIIEELRVQRNRSDGERALTLWRALLTGSLSLLERIDTDGKRLYDLYENPPWRIDLRALTEREASVVSQAIRGLGNKQIGYALGITEAYASRLLGTAGRKLGLPSARSLLRVAGQLLQSQNTPCSVELSPAERDVLRLLVEGYSNREIAEHRGVAARTVANQVASVLAKTGAASRREWLGRSVPAVTTSPR